MFKYLKKNPSIILVIGAVLLSLRIIFPVLSCLPPTNDGILFFSFGPQKDCVIHTYRTNSEAIVIVLLTIVFFWHLNKSNKEIKKN